MTENKMIKIEVAYALPDEQVIISVEVTEGTTIEQAIQFSTVIEKFPEINLDALKVGIFGKLKKRNQALRAGDRIEIYRPLIADPKESAQKTCSSGKSNEKRRRR